MSTLDWIIIAVYIAALVAMSVWLGQGQENDEDYYVGGRDLPWWAVGISTMATQSSVVSFISIPAFVAIKEGGGFTWLQYELAVPLAMIFVMVLLVPFFRKLELISVYEYLEMRFDLRVRLFMSAVFLIARGIGTGAGVYATALILQVVTGLSFAPVVLLVGVITIIYDTIGGMKAVVWSDVVQMVVLVVGVVICIGYCVDIAGGVGATLDSLAPERWTALDPALGLDGSSGAPLWAYLIGGFFLYASYYGADQSQTQRELSAPTLEDTKRSLVLNGLGRFPLTVLYLAFGIAIGGAFVHLPELQAAVAESGKADTLVPRFVVDVLPQGIRAVIVAAMLAAAMSSLDSALNSLSAATMQDFVLRFKDLDIKSSLRASKITTVIWGRGHHRPGVPREGGRVREDGHRGDQQDRLGLLWADPRRVRARRAQQASRCARRDHQRDRRCQRQHRPVGGRAAGPLDVVEPDRLRGLLRPRARALRCHASADRRADPQVHALGRRHVGRGKEVVRDLRHPPRLLRVHPRRGPLPGRGRLR
jgi:SSS family transporter